MGHWDDLSDGELSWQMEAAAVSPGSPRRIIARYQVADHARPSLGESWRNGQPHPSIPSPPVEFGLKIWGHIVMAYVKDRNDTEYFIDNTDFGDSGEDLLDMLLKSHDLTRKDLIELPCEQD